MQLRLLTGQSISSALGRALAMGALVLLGCAQSRLEQGKDGVTHWLRECESSAECGPLECLCGVCTMACGSDGACAGLGAVAKCAAPELASCGGAAKMCIATATGAGGAARSSDSGSSMPAAAPNDTPDSGPIGSSMAGQGGTGGMSVMPSMAGSASAGSVGAAPNGLTPEACLQWPMMAGQEPTDCERCRCRPEGCLDEIKLVQGDVPAAEMFACGLENDCDQECCLCGAKCGLTNYGTGPCAAQIERAAGTTPGLGLSNVAVVMRNCVLDGPADNSCAKVTRLERCIAEKCGDLCPLPPVCM